MWFILYQVALIGFDILALAFENKTILSIEPLHIGTVTLPIVPLIIVGFLLNLSVIVLLYLMIDDMDAKMMILDKAYEGVNPGEFTQKIFTMDDRYFYLPLYAKK